VTPALEDLFATADLDAYTGTAELRAAGRAALGGALISLGIGAFAAFAGRRASIGPERVEQADRAVAIGAVALVVAGAIGFTAATGDPVGWVDDRVDEFLTQGSPDSEGQASRFGVNAGSERDDLWRVALDDAGENPLQGLGGGGYQYSYLQNRSEEGLESVRDAHSVELEVLSELGIPGLVFLLLALGGAAGGAWRARGLSPAGAALGTCALTAAAYWLAHSSLDWFWTYPGPTAPVFALLGSACALGGREPGTAGSAPWRRMAAAGAVILAITVVPPFLAERYIESAYAGWRSDPERAQEDLDRARDLNVLSIEPLLAEGGIARAQGDRERALAAFAEAAEERPEEWASFYFIAQLSLKDDPGRARAALDRALELNPLGKIVQDLGKRIEQRIEQRAS
jgi:tetratricopeptide (TPR) repeat protein